MKSILDKLFTGNQDDAVNTILDVYSRQHFAIVDYLYFANISGKKLFETHNAHYHSSDFQDALLEEYKKKDISHVCKAYHDAIKDADLVLPDGIALQMFYFLAKKEWLSKLNGTDFAPYLLDQLFDTYGNQRLRILLYGTYPDLLAKTKLFLQKKGYQVVYAQDGYTNLDWNSVEKALPHQEGAINVLLVARTTPVYPIQEIWSYANKEQIKKYHLLVMNQGGTFDFRVGKQKRSPKIIRYLRLERLRRLVSDPKRNYKKVLDSLGIFPIIFSYLLLKRSTR